MIEELIIVTRELNVARGVEESLPDGTGIRVICGDFEQIETFDCVATAGNSFGLMDAGMDLAIINYFGREIQDRIQEIILRDYLGEQPVGTSFLVETGALAHPWLAHTPTMRVPMNICGTDYVYLATWATLLAVRRHNLQCPRSSISTLVCPAFGTGTGGIAPQESGVQIRIAWENFCTPPANIHPSLAQTRHNQIFYVGRWGFQHERPKSRDK